ncbi:GTP-binding protein EngB required for normal cell division [Actimicrobium sp. GrIS 1.19]|uniref:LeoA/HP0731 family dynamin-like GTPase n=1 Tax=Actimicrobium sp. GrIS 1.19 TaxID=3071708 RepID=UPI002E0B268B|nr:GTP-binding protein EngB required for normal cell division [Actimicrobium sp. GrIS 1.19]
MDTTLEAFKAQQSRSLNLLVKLQDFLAQGEQAGVDIDVNLKHKLENAVRTVAGEKLKVALIGGYSDGKTSIAAAWMERLDASTMKISHQESSNEVRVYEVGSDFVLIDTPGLFGYKEQMNLETHQIEKYKDITKKYISEAHLVLYVMDPTNPIKASHQSDLEWLFRSLNLLPRTVFVLSRFDEVADLEDDAAYDHNLAIKQDNVVSRLTELLDLTSVEAADLSIVAVAANPFDMGTDHWLSHLDQFKALSHIHTLQQATANKIKENGGAIQIVEEAKHSVIRDVLGKQMPLAAEQDQLLTDELARLDHVAARMHRQMLDTQGLIADVRISLRQFVTGYFSDLILQASGVDIDTFTDFFEREVGSDGVVVTTRLQNEFERQLKSVTQDISAMRIGFDTEINHFNSLAMQFGRKGVNFVVANIAINNTTILAARDSMVGAGKLIGVDLAKMLGFKPWGATNLAHGINGALAAVGLALEAWDSWEKAKRQEQFRKVIEKMVENFNAQRIELLALLDGEDFTRRFFTDYIALQDGVSDIVDKVNQQRARSTRFHEWRTAGESLSCSR